MFGAFGRQSSKKFKKSMDSNFYSTTETKDKKCNDQHFCTEQKELIEALEEKIFS